MRTRKMRMLAASLALVMCVSLYSAPKSKAVAVETAIGTAAVASYFQATGLTMAASAGSTGALVTTGVADIVGSYAMATGAASSGSAFLSSLTAGVSISPAGALVLTAAAVVAIGALVAWYIGENGLEEEGNKAVAVPGTSEFYSYNGIILSDIDGVWDDKETYPYATIVFDNDTETYKLYIASVTCFRKLSDERFYMEKTYGSFTAIKSWEAGLYEFLDSGEWSCHKLGTASQSVGLYSKNPVLWSSYPVLNSDGSLFLDCSDPIPAGDSIQNQLEISRAPEFTQPDTELQPESKKQMVIDLGLTPGITLDEAVIEIPDRIAVGTLAPTYEITSTETGEGTTPDEGADSDDLVYVPMLERIQNAITGLGDSIVDGIMDGLKSLVVPDEAFFTEAIPALQETFQGRTGLLTFPISLLADFLDRLLTLSDQEPILRWDSVWIYGKQLITAGQYNLKDSLVSVRVKQMYDLYMVLVNAILVFAFLGLCQNKYRKIMQN